jgi:MFS family permease
LERSDRLLNTPEILGEGEPISPLSTPKAKVAQRIDELPKAEKLLPLRALLTRRVIIAAGNYASLSLVDISFRAIQPLFLSTPIHLGGLGLPPSTIGYLMSIFGVLNGVFQVLFFARINDRWGPKRVFFWGIASGIPVFASFPVINYLARHNGYSTTVWIAVGFQIVIPIALSVSYGQYFYFVLFRVALPLTLSLPPPQALSSFSLPMHHPIGPLSEQPTV